jgi:hypothetical protein
MSTPEQQAIWDAEKAAAKPCPTGRVKVEGTVLKVEERTNPAHKVWGTRTVMVVKSVEGWCVWCSVPKGATVERDCKIVFEVTLTPSETDPKFAFGHCPKLIKEKL